MIKIEMSKETAEAVRYLLHHEQELYTKDPVCVPERITHLREIITSIDEQL
jgi:hypothetical protein